MRGNNNAPRVANIWAGENPWGYRFNVNNPIIKRHYIAYQLEHGLDIRTPLTDAQRLDFEREIMEKMRKNELT